jgi:heptosyltransferase-2
MKKILIIQTAFIGDVILATALIEKLKEYYPEAQIDFVVRKGCESLLLNHPFLSKIYVFDKQKSKYRHLWQLISEIRQQQYDIAINVQRFTTTGIMTLFSGAKQTIGFDKNPFSVFFSKKIKHTFTEGKHETQRNQQLIAHLTDNIPAKPRLYPTEKDFSVVLPYQSEAYVCIAPASVWFTKQLPTEKWVEFIKKLPFNLKVYLLGGKEDIALCEKIKNSSGNLNVEILAGKLSLQASAALMAKAVMNYMNDSSPMHLASAMNAPTSAIFCSTVPEFGFGPLADKSFIIQTSETLPCKPCGIHGHKDCPEGHFRCGYGIETDQMKNILSS